MCVFIISEEFALSSFEHFSEDMDKKIKKIFLNNDSLAYHNIIVSNYSWVHRPMSYSRKDVEKYSFKELYEQMTSLFNKLEDGDKNAIYKIIFLKNFINYKMNGDKMEY